MKSKNGNPLNPFKFSGIIINGVKTLWSNYYNQMRPRENASTTEKIIKNIGLVLGSIVFVLLSPVVLVTLFIAILIAF